MMKPEDYMKIAMAEAAKASRAGDVPVGCVVVLDGDIIGRGHNRRERIQSVQGHAEMMALAEASETVATWRLEGADLYVTLEPCMMCAGAIMQARVARVYYGASDPKTGCCGNSDIGDLFATSANHHTEVIGGIMRDECSAMLKDFFARRREEQSRIGNRTERKRDAIERWRERRDETR